jgi:hypothetical protein
MVNNIPVMLNNFHKNFPMHLNISPNRMISDVQQEFNNMYPFLKLEFYRNKIYQLPDFTLKNILPHKRKIADGQMAITDGELEIKPEMTVRELEKIFTKEFFLLAQVFRRSGNIWLQTSMTDSWTLRQQNEHGKEISTSKGTSTDINDYDLNRDPD